jgi:hypothetical protein
MPLLDGRPREPLVRDQHSRASVKQCHTPRTQHLAKYFGLFALRNLQTIDAAISYDNQDQALRNSNARLRKARTACAISI